MSTVQNSFSRSFSIIFYISDANPALKLSRQIYLDLVSSPMNISRPEFTLAFNTMSPSFGFSFHHVHYAILSVPFATSSKISCTLTFYSAYILPLRRTFKICIVESRIKKVPSRKIIKNCGQTVAFRKMESNVSTAFGIPPSSHEIRLVSTSRLQDCPVGHRNPCRSFDLFCANMLPTTAVLNHTAGDHEPNTTHQHYMTVFLYCDKRP
ncbi:hypothetical protein T09_11477 [Trichinella sp. T9]|nr:hypothetical protein T09_11477 [Trichinella sp. T9]